MDFIKDKKGKLIELTNELIDFCGEPKEIAKRVDDVIFDYISHLCTGGDCVGECHNEVIFTLKSIRDLFVKLN
jgi:hypothetical protein